MRAAREGLLVRPDRLRRRRAVAPHRARGDLRPGALGADLSHARRGRRQGQQHELRTGLWGVERKGQPHALGRRATARRRHLGQHLQPLRSREPLRRACASRASVARVVATGWRRTSMSDRASTFERPTSCSSTAPFRVRSRAAATRSPRPRAPSSRTSAQGSRKDVRDAVVAARARADEVVGPERLQPRSGDLPAGRDGRVAPRRTGRARGPRRGT